MHAGIEALPPARRLAAVRPSLRQGEGAASRAVRPLLPPLQQQQRRREGASGTWPGKLNAKK